MKSEQAPPAPDTQEPKAAPKKTPAEEFAELKECVYGLQDQVNEVFEFSLEMKRKVLKQDFEVARTARKQALESLFTIHNAVYRHLLDAEARGTRASQFIEHLFQLSAAELRNNGVEIIAPSPGDAADYRLMKAIAFEPCPFWKKPNRVFRVESLGFAESTAEGRAVIQKATVTILRREHDEMGPADHPAPPPPEPSAAEPSAAGPAEVNEAETPPPEEQAT